jgi:hypothetical protein
MKATGIYLLKKMGWGYWDYGLFTLFQLCRYRDSQFY